MQLIVQCASVCCYYPMAQSTQVKVLHMRYLQQNCTFISKYITFRYFLKVLHMRYFVDLGQELMAVMGVQRVRCDQCHYGEHYEHGQPVKKPT